MDGKGCPESHQVPLHSGIEAEVGTWGRNAVTNGDSRFNDLKCLPNSWGMRVALIIQQICIGQCSRG